MIRRLNRYGFANAFEGTETYSENFSRQGLLAMYEFFEQVEYYEDREIDVIAICCEFTEYVSLEDFAEDYGRGYSDIDKRFKYPIEDNTAMIRIPNSEGFIIMNF